MSTKRQRALSSQPDYVSFVGTLSPENRSSLAAYHRTQYVPSGDSVPHPKNCTYECDITATISPWNKPSHTANGAPFMMTSKLSARYRYFICRTAVGPGRSDASPRATSLTPYGTVQSRCCGRRYEICTGLVPLRSSYHMCCKFSLGSPCDPCTPAREDPGQCY